MITALDSSVLWAILKREPGHESWIQAFLHAAAEGPPVISPVAFAELAPSTRDAAELSAFLDRLAITYDPISPSAAHLAGLTFKRYRKAVGPRRHLIPDFLIAARALTQSDRRPDSVYLEEVRSCDLYLTKYIGRMGTGTPNDCSALEAESLMLSLL